VTNSPRVAGRSVGHAGLVCVRGAREHNLKNVDVDIPRDALVVFTGVSGSGKSSLAFGTLYAEAQRRFLESVSPYARRLFHQLAVPDVDEIEGLPPAIALQQQRGGTTARSSVGSVTTLSNLVRMLYSRAGDYPAGQAMLHAEDFSPNSPQGACQTCHGIGQIYDATESSMVPDPGLTIRERAIAAWPPAWHGQNLRDIVVTLGYDVDTPWRRLPKRTRDWLLFTEEHPTVPVYAGYTPQEVRRAVKRKEEPSYMGTFTGARHYVLHTFATTESAVVKRRVARYVVTASCPVCHGKRLRHEALAVTFAGLDIAAVSSLPLSALADLIRQTVVMAGPRQPLAEQGETQIVARRIGDDLLSRLDVLLDLGLGYLALDRSTPTLSPGELQRLRLATQVRSNLFGVVYVLDEPSAGLHPADSEALLRALDRLKASGNSLFVIEHDLDIIRHADWIVDVGPGAGSHGGEVLYSGPLEGLPLVQRSATGRYLRPPAMRPNERRRPRAPQAWLRLTGVTRNNLRDVDVEFPIATLTTVTGVSGSGKSSLISQALVDLVTDHLGHRRAADEDAGSIELADAPVVATVGHLAAGVDHIRRLVQVDQRPIGRTPRSNLATYTGLFDQVRKLFAATPLARKRRYSAGRFSFNVAAGRCSRCAGEGFVMIELLFLPSVYTPCPVCHGLRYNPPTLEVEYRGTNIAGVLGMTVDDAWTFFAGDEAVRRSLAALRQVGVGYLRLGQPATELSGGEAQRIKLATELQHGGRAGTLYVLDEPTTGLHPADVDKLLDQLALLVDAGNTVIVVEHEIRVMVASDWIVDIGPGAGEAGGRVVAAGPPSAIASARESRTAPYLRRALGTEPPSVARSPASARS
jgi:excinuclease ABC subunit A